MGNEKVGPDDGERLSGGDSAPSLSDDDLYRALASRQRRRVLSTLLIEEESTVEELSTVLTGWQATEANTMGTAEDRTEVMITLKHSALPILDETGFVTFDSERGTVEMKQVPSAVRELIHRSVEGSHSSRS